MSFTSFNWFLFIGVGSSAIYVVLSTILHYLGVPAWQASFVSFATCIPLAYYAQKSLAFRSKSPHKKAFPRYIAVQAIGLFLSALVPRLLVSSSLSVVSTVLVFVLVAGTTSLISFLVHRRWTYA